MVLGLCIWRSFRPCHSLPLPLTASYLQERLLIGPSFPLAPVVAPLSSGLTTASWGGVQRHGLIKILVITWFLNRFMALEEERSWAELSAGNGLLKRSWWANFQPTQIPVQGL